MVSSTHPHVNLPDWFIDITQASIRLHLAIEDSVTASKTTQRPLHAAVTLSMLIDTGIELEEQQ